VSVDAGAGVVERRVRSEPVVHERRRGHRPVRVLVVEHDVAYQKELRSGLEAKGYVVDQVAQALDGLRRFIHDPPDVVLVDVLLPGIPAIELCSRLRSLGDVPVLMITAVETEVDLGRALDAGAVDYVARPHRMRELAARIEVARRPLTRRVERVVPVPPPTRGPSGMLAVGDLAVDCDSRRVTIGDEVVHLPRLEFDLLALLVSAPDRLWHREALIEQLWSDRHCAGSRTLDTHVRRLRQKLERGPGRGRHLVTVRGVGFRYDTEPSAPARDLSGDAAPRSA